jgi:hypothetical protein
MLLTRELFSGDVVDLYKWWLIKLCSVIMLLFTSRLSSLEEDLFIYLLFGVGWTLF